MQRDEQMLVTVRLFAILAEIAGGREIELSVPKDATGRDVLDALVRRFPPMRELEGVLRLALNQEYAAWESPVSPRDEIALIPPVSGGGGDPDATGSGQELPFVEVTEDELSADRYQRRVLSPLCGAVCTFVGVVREVTGERRTEAIRYEAYEAMARQELERVARQMMDRWPMARVAIGHRVGLLHVGDASVIVAVATPHRPEAFAAARFGIDTLKEQVPIWKKEYFAGGEEWVGVDA